MCGGVLAVEQRNHFGLLAWTELRYRRLVLLVCVGIGILLAVYASPFSSSKDSADHGAAAIKYRNNAAAIANTAGGTGAI